MPSAACQPIGWNTSRMNMHYKAVYPQKAGGGMQVNLHKNMTKSLLPKELHLEETRNIECARRILYRQKIGAQVFVGGAGRSKTFLEEWKANNYSLKQRPETTPEGVEKKATFLPSVFSKMAYPSTPNSRYSADDVARLVYRLSKKDPEKIPESKGYPVKFPATIVYKKKYKEEEIDQIVRRLSTVSYTRPSDTRGSKPLVVRTFPRQTMSKVNKSSSEEVQDVVERLAKYDNEMPESRGESNMESLD